MILPLLLAWQEVPAALPPSEAEIVVIARKSHMIQVDLKAPKRNGRVILKQCGIRNSTGYAQLDMIPCAAAQECMLDAPTTQKQLVACVEQKSQTRIDAVIAGWRAGA